MREFKVNEYITLKLEKDKTFIYINNKRFLQKICLVLNIPKNEIEQHDSFNSIDEAAEKSKKLYENQEVGFNESLYSISPEQEFWAHCSNLQVWVENEYDTQLLNSPLAFSLLKELTDLDVPGTKRVLKEEISKRLQRKTPSVINYLMEGNYLKYLHTEEIKSITGEWVRYKGEIIPIFNLTLNLKRRNIKNLLEIEGLFEYASLKELDLNGNNISSLPENIGVFTSLKKLDLSFNKLTKLPESIGNLSSLEKLDLSYNQLKILPESIGNLISLKKLELFRNPLTILPESIGNLISIQKLGFWENKLTILPESIGNLTSLKNLNLEANQITSLPESIGNLTSLEELRLGCNRPLSLPESIGNLTSLKKIHLESAQLTKLPESIGNLSSLEEIRLSYNKLRILPESIGNLTSLKRLLMFGNKLINLPESIGNLTSLKYLNLERNQVTYIPETFGNLKSLKSLNLVYNQITSLPETFGNLKSLKSLNLAGNQISSIPETLRNLKSLKSLNLSENKLVSVPGFIGSIKTLVRLGLNYNDIKTIPESICNLKSLEELGLRCNQISNFPKSLIELSSLKRLRLLKNPLDPRSKELAKQLTTNIEMKRIIEKAKYYKELNLQNPNTYNIDESKDVTNRILISERIFFNPQDLNQSEMYLNMKYKKYQERGREIIFYIDEKKTKINEEKFSKENKYFAKHYPFRTRVFLVTCNVCKKRYLDVHTKLYSSGYAYFDQYGGHGSGHEEYILVCPEGHDLSSMSMDWDM